MPLAIDTSHDCPDGGDTAPGLIAVQRKAASTCCNAKLAEGGSDATGYHCTGCGQPAQRTLGQRVAHWTCTCGQRRSQVLTQAADVPAEVPGG